MEPYSVPPSPGDASPGAPLKLPGQYRPVWIVRCQQPFGYLSGAQSIRPDTLISIADQASPQAVTCGPTPKALAIALAKVNICNRIFAELRRPGHKPGYKEIKEARRRIKEAGGE